MAEPEEESDEEWHRIADVVHLIEQQFNQARAQTAQGTNGRQENLGEGSIQGFPPDRQVQQQEISHTRAQTEQSLNERRENLGHGVIQNSARLGHAEPQQFDNVRAEMAHSVNMGRENLGDGMIRASPPVRQVQQQAPNLQGLQISQSRVVVNQFQEQPVSRKRGAPLSSSVPTPQSSSCAQRSSRTLQRRYRLQGPAVGVGQVQESESIEKIEELKATIAALQEEKIRMKTEYTTKVRHLEARVSHSNETNRLRSKLKLAELELRELRNRPLQTQGGEVVEATQTGFEVLKGCIKSCEEGKDGVIFGGWGVDKRFDDGELRKRLFEIGGLVRCSDIVMAGVKHDWGGVVKGLVELLEGEGWYMGVQGLGVVLLSKEGRDMMVDTRVVRRLLKLRCVEVMKVVEGIVMGCAEVGMKGDTVRKCVIVDDYIRKMFRRGHYEAGEVMKSCVITALECEDGRIGDEEWNIIEEIIVEAGKMVCVTSVGKCCLEILACCAVLAGDVLIRCGGIEALFNVVVDGVLTNEEYRRNMALQALKEICQAHHITVSSSVKIVVLPFLLQLVRTEHTIATASYVTAALLNS